MDPKAEGLQFLDWAQLAQDERNLLQRILFGEETGCHEDETAWQQEEWSPQQEYDTGEMYEPMRGQQQSTTMYPVMLPSPGVLVGNLNLNVNANLQSFMSPAYHPQQYESKHETRRKPKNKPRQEENFQPQYMFHNQAYSYVPHHTSAQHVAGPPLYISAQVPMYNQPPPQPMYYPPVYFPMMPQQMEQPVMMDIKQPSIHKQAGSMPAKTVTISANTSPMPVNSRPSVVMPAGNVPVPAKIQAANTVPAPNITPVNISSSANVGPTPVETFNTPINTSIPANVVPNIPTANTSSSANVGPTPVESSNTPVTSSAPNVVPNIPTVNTSSSANVGPTPVDNLHLLPSTGPVLTNSEPVLGNVGQDHSEHTSVGPTPLAVNVPLSTKNIPKPEPASLQANLPNIGAEPIKNEPSIHQFVQDVAPQETQIRQEKPEEKQDETRFKMEDLKSELPPFKKPVQPAPAVKSWASIVQSNQTTPLQDAPQNMKPLARVNPFTPVNAPEVAPLAKRQQNIDPLLDDPALYRLGEYLCKYQLDHRSSPLQPRGLTNRGNWCYVNATLQALLACPPFFNLMRNLPIKQRNHKHLHVKSATPVIDAVVEFMQEFSTLPPGSRPARKEKAAARKGEEGATVDVPQGPAFEPSCVYSMLPSIRSAAFKVEGRQEDAEEFLSCLLNALNDEMLELTKLVEEDEPEPAVAPAEESDQWSVIRSKNRACVTRRSEFGRTPVSDIFRGQLCSHVQRKGEQQSENVQPFYTLQLDIEKARSVTEALEQMVARDWLEGVTCSRTQQQIEAWQQVTLEELPPVLLLHLKWFDYQGDGCTKVMRNMDYSVDLKIDNKLLSNSKKKYTPRQRDYKLFAVVYHEGQEASKGHYMTDAYHSAMGVWVRYDDSQVRVVPESTVTHPRLPSVPYLLYYRRCDTMGLPSLG